MRATVVFLALALMFALGAVAAQAASDTDQGWTMAGMPMMGAMRSVSVDDMQRMHEAVPQSEMDRMHAAMRSEMPADLVAQCDAMHAAMGAGGSEMLQQHELHH